MKIGAVISEFNPFHNGHEYLINESKRLMGEGSGVVALMSGDFVQRGEPAIFPKELRAEAAIESGADLVIELPLPYSMSSAEGFASYAVKLLNELSIVSELFFGSESANLNMLSNVASALLRDEITDKVTDKMKEGISFPAAREKVLRDVRVLKDGETIKPNDILAIEYIKALIKSDSHIKPYAVKREGAEHDSEKTSKNIASASYIRNLILKGKSADAYISEKVSGIYKRAVKDGIGPVSLASMEKILLSRLRFLKAEELALLPDAAEGIENMLYKNIKLGSTFEETVELSVSKRYPRSRIKRMLLYAALGITKEDVQKYKNPPYFRVLAANANGVEILRELSENSLIPSLIKPSYVKKLGKTAESYFKISASARDFYSLAIENDKYKIPGGDYRLSPLIKTNF